MFCVYVATHLNTLMSLLSILRKTTSLSFLRSVAISCSSFLIGNICLKKLRYSAVSLCKKTICWFHLLAGCVHFLSTMHPTPHRNDNRDLQVRLRLRVRVRLLSARGLGLSCHRHCCCRRQLATKIFQ